MGRKKLRNCARCGRAFVSSGEKLCSNCRRKAEEILEEVKEYLAQCPQAKLKDIAENTEASRGLVLDFLRQGRLRMKKAQVLRCKICGRTVERGSLCKSCATRLRGEEEDDTSDKEGYFYTDRFYRDRRRKERQ